MTRDRLPKPDYIKPTKLPETFDPCEACQEFNYGINYEDDLCKVCDYQKFIWAKEKADKKNKDSIINTVAEIGKTIAELTALKEGK